MQIYFKLSEILKTKKQLTTNADLLLIMRNSEDQKTTARNANLFLIMRNLEDQKTTATNADLLLIKRNPEGPKSNCNKCRFTFNYAKH